MSKLMTPVHFAGLDAKNRIVMPPMATAIEGPGGSLKDDGFPSEPTIAHYRQRAQDGVGMIIVEHTYVSQCGKAHKGQLGLDNDSAIPRFEVLCSAIRDTGTVAVIQLNHAGAAGNPEVTGSSLLGPSDKPNPNKTLKPNAMTEQDIENTQKAFAKASKRAKSAGFQAVEIHCAHGYLGNQFLSPLTNLRTDSYGGALENRARFVVEIVEEIHKAVGRDFPVFVRLGTDDGIQGGIVPEVAAKIAEMLESSGVAMIDVSGGFKGSRGPEATGQGYFVPAAKVIKEAVNIPVMVTGGITDALFAEKVLAQGDADLVGIGRALLRDPDWVNKALQALK